VAVHDWFLPAYLVENSAGSDNLALFPWSVPSLKTRDGIMMDCLLCRIAGYLAPAVIVHEDHDLMVIMDLYPATRGHMLVFPRKHIENIYSMPEETAAHIMSAAVKTAKIIKRELHTDGLNLVQSNEKGGGQTTMHFHLHIVPRYENDPVKFSFGHGRIPADIDELKNLALTIHSKILE
jgi:histidine triad (HIT) family protein